MRNKVYTYKSFWVIVGVFVMVAVTGMGKKQKFIEKIPSFSVDAKISDVLLALGEQQQNFGLTEKNNPTLILKGKEIVHAGRTTTPDGKKSRRVSNYFNCTNCHNTAIEDPDLTKSDPDARLKYVMDKKMPLLPASTFYGVVNRTGYYNGDYALKYGKLVEPARHNLVNAMQLCATECAQGRKMEDWEIKAVLAYFYSIEYTMQDLGFSTAEMDEVNATIATGTESNKQKKIAYIRSKFYNASPATFVSHNNKSIRNYGQSGNVENGQKVYENSCMTCHKSVGGVTNFKLDMEKVTFRLLKRNLKKNNHYSVYFMVRKGTYAVPGYKPYMPNFSQERLSNTQMEDLVAFINQQAK